MPRVKKDATPITIKMDQATFDRPLPPITIEDLKFSLEDHEQAGEHGYKECFR